MYATPMLSAIMLGRGCYDAERGLRWEHHGRVERAGNDQGVLGALATVHARAPIAKIVSVSGPVN
jgi:hypothetical protein